MSDPIESLLTAYEAGHQRLTAALARCPRGMWDFKPEPARWSVHEIILHIADCEAHFYVRMRHILAEPGHGVTAFDQDLWAGALSYGAQNADDALDLTRLIRKLTAELLRLQPASAWDRAMTHPEAGLVTLKAAVEKAASHMDAHIQQITRVLMEWQGQRQQAQQQQQ